MHRLGERCERLDEICRVFGCENLKIEGVYTHLCADDTATPEDRAFTLTQGDRLHQALVELEQRGHHCPKWHLLASYGLQFTAQRDMKSTVLAIGYADGLPRALSCGAGRVLIRGGEARIVGRICMDQTLVDVSNIPDVASGDVAVVIGRSGTKEITVCDIAAQANTISNEILSRLGERLERTIE